MKIRKFLYLKKLYCSGKHPRMNLFNELGFLGKKVSECNMFITSGIGKGWDDLTMGT